MHHTLTLLEIASRHLLFIPPFVTMAPNYSTSKKDFNTKKPGFQHINVTKDHNSAKNV